MVKISGNSVGCHVLFGIAVLHLCLMLWPLCSVFDCIEVRWLRREDGMDGGGGEGNAVLEYST